MLCATVLFTFSAACVEKEKALEAKKSAPLERRAKGLDIAVVLAEAGSYRDREVTVSGNAAPGLAFEFVDEQPYLLNDGTGEIWVITTDVMPAQDAWVTVTGTVRAPYQIKGRNYTVVIVEARRQ